MAGSETIFGAPMTPLRNTAAAIVAAVAGWLSVPAVPAIDAERARCDAAVAVAYAALADAPAPPAPPSPPAPDSPCAGKCTNGVYKPDGRIEARCGKDCPCGCATRQDAPPPCRVCLGTKNVMGHDGVVRRCTACVVAVSGTTSTR